MSFPVRFGATLVLLSLAIAGIFDAAKTIEERQVRTDYELCQELEYEVQLSVESELLTQSEADKLIRRCYTLFVS